MLVVIILKCIEILNHSVLHQKLNIVFRSIILQTNSEKEVRFAVTRSWSGEKVGGELDEDDQKVQTSRNKLNKYYGYNVQHD